MSKPTAINAAASRQWSISEFNNEIIQDETGNTVAEAFADFNGTAADTAALIVRAVNLLAAHEAVAEASKIMLACSGKSAAKDCLTKALAQLAKLNER